MIDRPVLATIRELLKFRDSTTIAEIAAMSGTPKRAVLEIVNANGGMVWRDRKSGRITKVDPQGVLRAGLWNGGKFFTAHEFGDNQDSRRPVNAELRFEGHKELRQEMSERVALTYGFTNTVRDTPENRARLIAAGCAPWTEITIDDRLWIEGKL